VDQKCATLQGLKPPSLATIMIPVRSLLRPAVTPATMHNNYSTRGWFMPDHRSEKHFNGRIGWLRAAVLGANDGIISTSCLLLGVASANLARSELLLTGIAALVAGAISIASSRNYWTSRMPNTVNSHRFMSPVA
jgi:VIT1/CCC1 family predicted Fe2+/Mn2+ transporter